MSANGVDDDKIQPEHTRNYTFTGQAAMDVDGKDEKKKDEEESETDSDSDVDELESDEPDEETKVKSLSDAVPAGWKTASLPPMDEKLVGQNVVFKWSVIGWAKGVVSCIRQGRKASKFNFEITYPPDVTYPHKLGHSTYSTSDAALVGAWCVLVPE
jgi:hypothetical protein